MPKSEATIAAATGISVGGRSPASKAVEVAMQSAALAAHANGDVDGKALRKDMLAARHDAKPEARR